jgi:hypothetical protein
MTYRPGKPTRYGSTATALVECSVRVSPTLARLIRKSAEKEASNASATDALLMAVGIQPGEIASSRNALERASEESKQWREKAAREQDQVGKSKIAAADWDKERALIRGDLCKSVESLKLAQQRTLTLEARIAELATMLENRDTQIAGSLSLSGLSDSSAAAVRALRDHLVHGNISFTDRTVGDVEAMIANIGRPEICALSKALTRRDWRTNIVRWLLRIREAPSK